MKKLSINSIREYTSSFAHKKYAIVLFLLLLPQVLSQKAFISTNEKKSETINLFEDIAGCSLGELHITDYIINKGLITTYQTNELLSEKDNVVIESLGIGNGLLTTALYNEQFRNNWITYKEEYIAVLDTLGVEESLAPRFHRAFSNQLFHSTDNTTITVVTPKDYSKIGAMVQSTDDALSCDFNEVIRTSIQLNISKKKINKWRFSPTESNLLPDQVSHKKAKEFFDDHGIGVRSSALHHDENGESYEHGRTCLEGLHKNVLGFLGVLSEHTRKIRVSGGTERGHFGEKYCVFGQVKGRSMSSAKKLHGAGNTIDIALHGIESLLLFEYFPHQQGRFSFLGYTGTYSYHAHGGDKSTSQSFKEQTGKFSSSMHLHVNILFGPDIISSSHSSPSDTITMHQQHRAAPVIPSI